MKKTLLYLIMLFCTFQVFAKQESNSYSLKDTIVKQIDTTITLVDTITYVIGKQAEIRKDTFTFNTNEATDPQLNKAKGEKLSEPENSLRISSAPYDAGRTTGVIDISPTGAATYTIPIALPPGINGVMPQVALSYNSQGGNGIAGYGWNISGLSTISRVPATRFHDNRVGGINCDPDDRFALDGQRLILKSGIYGGDGAEYQTENYSNIKIISRGVSAYGANYGPNSFEVYYPDGSKAYYGGSYDALSQLSYAISYSESAIGARISYYYAETRFISAITYGGIGSAPAINQINFIYEAPTRAEQAFIGGVSLFNNYLLKEVNVVANGTDFRHYLLNHDVISTLKYQRLTSVTEESGDKSKAFWPIHFTYDSQVAEMTYPGIEQYNLTGINQTNCKILTEDFTGNGTIDFIISPNVLNSSLKSQLYILADHDYVIGNTQIATLQEPGLYHEAFTAKQLKSNNKLFENTGLILVKPDGAYNLKVESYTIEPSLGTIGMHKKTEKVWENVPTNGYYSYCNNNNDDEEYEDEYVVMGSIPRKFLSGDFNGDGLTDIIAITKPYVRYYENQNCSVSGYNTSTASVSFLNIDPRVQTNYFPQSGSLAESIGDGNNLLTADFNGDGKTDILQIVSGKMYVYGLNEYNSIYKIWETPDNRIVLGTKYLIGDFNGDGKADIMFPTNVVQYSSPTQYYWASPGAASNQIHAVFFSTGKNFQKLERNMPFVSVNITPYNGYRTLIDYIAVDINGDNKSDIVRVLSDTRDNQTQGQLQISTFTNIFAKIDPNVPMMEAGPSINKFTTSLIHSPVPVFITGDKPNYSLEFGLISNNGLHSFKLKKDLKKESVIKSIIQDGIVNKITYRSLINTTEYEEEDELQLYQEESNQVYPYVDIHDAIGLKVVSKLERTLVEKNSTISQVFGYQGAISHSEGLGFLGFHKTTRSNWFKDDDYNRLYNIKVTNPQLRGATTKTFTTKYPSLNSTVENTPAIEPNIIKADPTVSQETVIASQSVTLKPGFIAHGINGNFIAKINNPATGINDNATINDYITRTDYTYDTSLSPEKIYTSVPTSVTTKDLLNGTNTTVAYTYDNFKNVTKETSNLSGAGTNTTEITYDNNLGSTYYVGRPLTKKTKATNANDTFTTEEEYTYTGFLPTQMKRKGNGTDWITENLQYDAFGNTTRKGIMAGSVERATTFEYDPTGRFMTKSTDLEGLETNFTYNASFGNLLTQTDPYGFTNTMIYDSWGRNLQTTDFLGVNTFTEYYSLGNGTIQIFNHDDEGNGSFITTDATGNKELDGKLDVFGNWITTTAEYDSYDRQIRLSEPEIYTGTFSQWNETTYDEYGRVNQMLSYTGKTTNISFNGLSTTVNDGTKSVTTTKNALGNTISVQDPGGTINYTYYANGNLKSSNFDGNEQVILQDGWGRKTQLTDPSAGQYLYTYNAFGESLIESTPKGVTTYVYDAIGKLQSKTIIGSGGSATNLAYQYTYDGTTKLLTAMTLANADGNDANYSYTYDNYKRLQSTVENNTYATFTKSFAFDGFGRVSTETSTALNKSNNKTATKTLLNAYQNGALKSITDNASSELIWQVNTINARGQVTMASLASGNIKQSNTYDQYGFTQELKTERMVNSPAVLMGLGYTFNTQNGILNNRTNSVFGSTEVFEHDNQDRLFRFIYKVGDQVLANETQDYDNKGRISNYSYLGDYLYNGASYQQTGLNNATIDAKRHYQDRVRQNITYNAFKSPVEISEQGIEKISFQYNAGLGRAHRYYGSDATDKMTRPFRKHYSEEGSMEITEDMQNGITSFVFYMGGDAYSAPAIWKEVHTGTNTVTQAMYYLHRDHLGSINLITDNQGVIKEQRQFDAWGNIVKLRDGNGNDLTDFVILDRGYTGHEHLLAVGLVHMNGRLYDPLLHRFLQPDNYIQFPYNSQNYNRYAYVLNNPLTHTDPSGEIIPVLVFVGAAIIGGGTNVWSNWDKIAKNPWSAISYFASGAAGGAVSLVNPWLGGSITAVSNIGIDAAYGNIPKFNGAGDIAKYIGGKALDGLGAAGAAGLSSAGYNLAAKLGWVQTAGFNGSTYLLGAGSDGIARSVTSPDFILKNTKSTILEPLVETLASQGGKLTIINNTGKSVTQGIYEFVSTSGKKYIGQSGNIKARLSQHIASGKLSPSSTVNVTEVLGGKTAREIAEQLTINANGGLKYLQNMKNPIGPARQYLLP
ncbi:RHS repeat-associated core domain-containing protein [Pedobacter alpinus]|uniref:RHS repeat-associated core domain-containing protein n=1 Tax=Pedobacter alpinus TaxID=1590643 RepID=A0ABW5TM67_9SPHI